MVFKFYVSLDEGNKRIEIPFGDDRKGEIRMVQTGPFPKTLNNAFMPCDEVHSLQKDAR